jgi:hypothetical protein
MLFETFRAWQDSDASVRGAAEVLICHPNTVRHRLRRIEKRTGRFSRAQGMSWNCRWLSKCTADSYGHVDGCWIHTDAGELLYRTTTPHIAASAKMGCGAVDVDRATTPSLTK